MFSEKLKAAMQQLNLKQSQVAGMTGCSKGAVSQYISGKNIPPVDKQREIAVSLGLPADYFERESQEITMSKVMHMRQQFIRIKPEEVAKIMHAGQGTIQRGLQDRRFDWGYAIPPKEEGGQWTYIINAKRFAEIERLELHE